MIPDRLSLIDAEPHQHRVISVGLELVPGPRVVGAGDHEGVQGDAADILLHLGHPDGLGLDAVHGQDPALSDVGDPVIMETHGPGRSGDHHVM